MKRDESIFLHYILDAITRTEGYLQDVDEAIFKQDTLIQDGVIRQIEIIGEAAKRLSDDLRLQYNQIPWEDIVGMRNKLIHDYFGVDIEKVWLTAKEDLPTLKTAVEKILAELFG